MKILYRFLVVPLAIAHMIEYLIRPFISIFTWLVGVKWIDPFDYDNYYTVRIFFKYLEQKI